MRTSPSTLNPFGASRHGYALEQVRAAGSRSHLDIGCYDGAFLQALAPLGVATLCGVDVNEDALSEGRPRYPALELTHVPDTRALPFADGTFDSVSLLDVLEHMADPTTRGTCSPRSGACCGPAASSSSPSRASTRSRRLDLGNLKFRFPRLHRAGTRRRHGADAYRHRYGYNPSGWSATSRPRSAGTSTSPPTGLDALLAGAGLSARRRRRLRALHAPLVTVRLLVAGPRPADASTGCSRATRALRRREPVRDRAPAGCRFARSPPGGVSRSRGRAGRCSRRGSCRP